MRGSGSAGLAGREERARAFGGHLRHARHTCKLSICVWSDGLGPSPSLPLPLLDGGVMPAAAERTVTGVSGLIHLASLGRQ